MENCYKFGPNVVRKGDHEAFNSPYAHGEIGAFETRSRETPPELHRPNGYLWRRASDQVAAKSLEWIHRAEFLNMSEFNQRRAKDGRKGKLIIIDKEGSPRTVEECGQIFLDPGSYHLGQLPYFLKISKTREAICCSENICNRRTYRTWRNMLYRAGYAETTIGESHRHSATPELEQVDRYFWNLALATSSKGKLSAKTQWGKV